MHKSDKIQTGYQSMSNHEQVYKPERKRYASAREKTKIDKQNSGKVSRNNSSEVIPIATPDLNTNSPGDLCGLAPANTPKNDAEILQKSNKRIANIQNPSNFYKSSHEYTTKEFIIDFSPNENIDTVKTPTCVVTSIPVFESLIKSHQKIQDPTDSFENDRCHAFAEEGQMRPTTYSVINNFLFF